jgi:hypothetical protein
MRRTTLGILAIFLIVLGFIVAWRGPEDGSAVGFAGGCVRVGLVLGAIWLAWPSIAAAIKRVPGWLVSWFVRGEKPSKAAGPRPLRETNESPKPAVRVKKPRRRSQG